MHPAPPSENGLPLVRLPDRQTVYHVRPWPDEDGMFLEYQLQELQPSNTFIIDKAMRANMKHPSPFVWAYPGGAMVLQRHPPFADRNGDYREAYLLAGPFDNVADAVSVLRLFL